MFQGFTKTILDLAHRHPGAVAATALASAAAPLFLKDEHRGYFRTALVTTPIVAAMGYAGPGLVTSASRTARSGLRFVREMPFFFNKNLSVKYGDVRNFLESGGIDLGALNPALKNWVDDAAIDFFTPGDRGAPPIEHSMEKAEQIFNRLMPDEGKRTLLTYAVEGARMKAMSPVQLAGVDKIGPLAEMAESDLRGIINANRANPKFVQEFSRRLRWAERLKDFGAIASPLETPATSIASVGFTEGFDLLARQRPEVAEAIQASIRAGHVNDATIIAEKSIDGSIGQVLGVNIKGHQGELKIPIFDPSTGTVRVGDEYQRLGVGRRLYSDKGVSDLDVFVSQNLTQNWKQLQSDIGRAAYFGGVDPLNEFKMATHGESQLATLPPHAMLLRSHAAVPTSLPMFGVNQTFNELKPLDKIALYRKMLSGGMTRIGSEGGVAKGVFEFGESELYTIGGLPSLAKQTPFYRAFAKELQLNASEIPEGWRPHVTSTAVQELGGVPEVRMAIAGISPQQKSLFGDLPADIKDLAAYENTAIKRIMTDTGVSEDAARAAWKKISSKLGQEGYLPAARKLGGLGEGGIILHEKFARLGMEEMATTRVSELHINPAEFRSKPFGPQQLIGFSGLEPVVSSAPQSFIESVSSVGGQFELTLRKRYPVETGAKVDVAGVKGLAILAEHEEFQRIRELMNLYGETAGGGVAIPNFADAIAPLNYTQAKVGDPFRLLLEQAAEVASQVSTSGTRMAGEFAKLGYQPQALTELNQYMFDLAGQGIYAYQDLHNRHLQFIEDAAFVQGSDRAERMRALTGRTAEFMESMGALALEGAPGTQSGLFASFRKSHMSNLLDYMQQNAMIASAGFWDTTRRNVPQMTAATYDLFSEMFRLGHLGGIQDIMGRMEFQGGSPNLAAEFARHFVQQDFTAPMGTSIPITEAVPGPAGVKLGTMEARAGSIFDPTRPDIQGNFSLALKEPVYARIGGRDVEVSHVPVLGKAAYGGGTNPFEKVGEGLAFGATDYEKSLAQVVRSAHSPAMMSESLSNYFNETYSTLFGKEGFYRAKGVDVQQAISGFGRTIASPADPFQIFISEQVARRVRDAKVRDALLVGEEVMATVARHPIQSAPYMRVKVAPDAGLGPNMVGLDERIRAMFGSDDDKDIFNLFFYRHGSQAEREALAAVNNLDSNQWKSVKTLEMLYGSAEDSRNIARAGVKSLPQMVEEGLAVGGTAEGRIEQVTQRMAGGAVGAYSNLLTRLMTNVEMHPTIGMNPEARTTLGHLFWAVRQVPISAQKGKMELNPEDPLQLWRKISAGLTAKNQQGAAEFISGMREVVGGFNKKSILDEQSAKIYSEMTGKAGAAGQEVNALSDLLESEKMQKLLSEFVINRNVQADRAAALLTRNVGEMAPDSLFAVHSMYMEMGRAFPYLQGMVGETRSGKMVSKALGAINDVTRAAAKEATHGAIPILALGLGLSATAAALTSNLKSPMPAKAAFSRGPGDFRPEERSATTDLPPGEAMPGQMSSVNPPRRQLFARRGVGTTIVAPMRQRVDLETTMRAQDRRDTTEVQRLVGQVAGGPGISNVNVNYRNGWRNKMSRLRQREIIREQLEQ